jgi:hypothetical protein
MLTYHTKLFIIPLHTLPYNDPTVENTKNTNMNDFCPDVLAGNGHHNTCNTDNVAMQTTLLHATHVTLYACYCALNICNTKVIDNQPDLSFLLLRWRLSCRMIPDDSPMLLVP